MSGWIPFNSKIFFKYFISYVFIFSIPLIILGSVIYYTAVINLRTEIEKSNLNNLNQVREMTDMRMTELRNIAARMAYDPRLTPYRVRNSGFDASEAIEELKKYKANSAIIEEVFLYFRGDSIIYSSEGSVSIQTLWNRIYQYKQWDVSKLEIDLNTVNIPILRPAEWVRVSNNNEERLLTYLNPIKPGNSNHYGTVMFLIQESMLNSLIEPILGDFKGSVFILDEDSQVLTSKNIGADFVNEKDLAFLQQERLDGIETLTFHNEKYAIMSVTSELTDWTFLTILPRAQFFERVGKVKVTIYTILLFILMLGLALASFLSLKHYRPIRDLAEFVKEQWSPSKKGKEFNELDGIRDTIGNVFDSHQDLLQVMDAQKPLIREQFLMNLLKGSYNNKQEIEDVLNSQHIEWHKSLYFVMYMNFDEKARSNLTTKYRELILNRLGHFTLEHEKVIGYAMELIHDHAIVFVVSLDEKCEINREVRQKVLEFISQQIQTDEAHQPTIGIGTIYSDMLHVNRSFIEASAAMEYRLRSKEPVIYFDDIMNYQDQTLWYPLEDKVKFVHSLKQGDRMVAMETLKSMMNSISKQEQSILLLKCMCLDIVNTVFKTLTEMNLKKLSQHVKKLLEFRTLDELEISLNEIIHKICDHVQSSRESNNITLRDNILINIQSNYKLYGFCLEQVADQYGLSVSYLSRFIKEQTGQNFIDYVTELRLLEVKNELRTSNKPIKEIIVDVGYLDVPSFTRKFKKIEGITPGQYRKLHVQSDHS